MLTIKSAEEIIKQYEEPFDQTKNRSPVYAYAKGFLELAKRVEPIYKALADFHKEFYCHGCKAVEALDLWEKIKGEKKENNNEQANH